MLTAYNMIYFILFFHTLFPLYIIFVFLFVNLIVLKPCPFCLTFVSPVFCMHCINIVLHLWYHMISVYKSSAFVAIWTRAYWRHFLCSLLFFLYQNRQKLFMTNPIHVWQFAKQSSYTDTCQIWMGIRSSNEILQNIFWPKKWII